MINKIASFMRQHQMVQKGDHISIGISGGADSVCLFLVLERLRRRMDVTISAIHVEHGIRGKESRADAEFVQKLAARYEIPFVCRSYPVEKIAKETGVSVEEAGRNVRYAAFAEEERRFWDKAKQRGGTVKTAVAHHGDDNAETVLFHLCRGSGIDGLFGIRPVRGTVIRPLLCVSKCEIEDFLNREGQTYRIDATNADIRYSRNRIRNRVMPELARINTQFTAHINRLSEEAAEISAYFDGEVGRILEKHRIKTDNTCSCIDTKQLFSYPSVFWGRVMLSAAAELAGSRKDFTREHVNALLHLAKGQTGRKIALPYQITAEKTYEGMILSRCQTEEEADETPIPLPIGELPGVIRLPKGQMACRIFGYSEKNVKIPQNLYTKWFDYDKIKNRLYFRTREPGDYFVLDAEGHRQKLKDYWINEKVPRSMRSKIWLLADGSHILWALGGRISEYYKVTEQTKKILEVRYMEDEK